MHRLHEEMLPRTAELLEVFRPRPYTSHSQLKRVEPQKAPEELPATVQTSMYARAVTPNIGAFRTPGIKADHRCVQVACSEQGPTFCEPTQARRFLTMASRPEVQGVSHTAQANIQGT